MKYLFLSSACSYTAIELSARNAVQRTKTDTGFIASHRFSSLHR